MLLNYWLLNWLLVNLIWLLNWLLVNIEIQTMNSRTLATVMPVFIVILILTVLIMLQVM